jgi:hypothetical protein
VLFRLTHRDDPGHLPPDSGAMQSARFDCLTRVEMFTQWLL